MKILSVEKIAGLFTITIDGILKNKKIGDSVFDNMGNSFIINSVAMSSGNSFYDNTVIVVNPTNPQAKVGDELMSD